MLKFTRNILQKHTSFDLMRKTITPLKSGFFIEFPTASIFCKKQQKHPYLRLTYAKSTRYLIIFRGEHDEICY